jgi:flagellar biosynthesis/type III secretory pathway protein FliH
MSITHKCEECGTREADECFCTRCLDELKEKIRQEGVDDGYYEGYRDGQEAGRKEK